MSVEKVTVPCAFCGKDVTRYPSQLKGKRYIFCGRECMNRFASKRENPEHYLDYRDYTNNAARFSELAKKNNPTKMTPEIREKLRNARLGSGAQKGYRKKYGRHEHRIVVEEKIGRPLQPGEIVHHIDGNKQNNAPENLRIMTQAEHARMHMKQRYGGGDAE